VALAPKTNAQRENKLALHHQTRQAKAHEIIHARRASRSHRKQGSNSHHAGPNRPKPKAR